MCASASVSVSLVNWTPLAWSWSRSSSAFSMMPLWTTAMRLCASVWGCALVSFGSPWVAQRVWPRPMVGLLAVLALVLAALVLDPLALAVCLAASLSRRSWTRPAVLVIWSLPRLMTARPAES